MEYVIFLSATVANTAVAVAAAGLRVLTYTHWGTHSRRGSRLSEIIFRLYVPLELYSLFCPERIWDCFEMKCISSIYDYGAEASPSQRHVAVGRLQLNGFPLIKQPRTASPTRIVSLLYRNTLRGCYCCPSPNFDYAHFLLLRAKQRNYSWCS